MKTIRVEQETALAALESLLDARIRSAKSGKVSKRTASAIFKDTYREPRRK